MIMNSSAISVIQYPKYCTNILLISMYTLQTYLANKKQYSPSLYIKTAMNGVVVQGYTLCTLGLQLIDDLIAQVSHY